MRIIIIIMLIASCLNPCGYTQSGTLKEAADKAYDLGRYQYAKDVYIQMALREAENKDKYPYLIKIALCYKYLNQPLNALQYFEQVQSIEPVTSDSLRFEYAELLVMTGKYQQALSELNKLSEKSAASNILVERTLFAMSDSASISKIIVTPLEKKLTIQTFGISLYDTSLVKVLPFSTKTNYSNFTRISLEDEEIEESINDHVTNFINFSYPSFDEKSSLLYFTANASNTGDYSKTFRKLQRVSREGFNNLFIYVLNYKKMNEVPEPLEFNNLEYSCVHPFISEDGNTLFFASDKPGGLGGFDLYVVFKTSNGWTTPKNLGSEVNTPEDEAYPFLYKNLLYFSSRGHLGYGGLDIFEYDTEKRELRNVGKPLNSTVDDFNFLRIDGSSGYFVSNRKENSDQDQIFEFQNFKDKTDSSNNQK